MSIKARDLVEPRVDGHDITDARGEAHRGISRRGFLTTSAVTATVAATDPVGALQAFADPPSDGMGLLSVFPNFASFFPADVFELPGLSDITHAITFVDDLFEHGTGSYSQTVTIKIPCWSGDPGTSTRILSNGQFVVSFPGIPSLKFMLGRLLPGDQDVYLKIQVDVQAADSAHGIEFGCAITFRGTATVETGSDAPSDDQYTTGIPISLQIPKELLKPKNIVDTIPDNLYQTAPGQPPRTNPTPYHWEDQTDGSGHPLDYLVELKTPPAYNYSDRADPQLRVKFGEPWSVEMLDPDDNPVDIGQALSNLDPAEIAGSGIIVVLNTIDANFNPADHSKPMGLQLNADLWVTTQDQDHPGQRKTLFGVELNGLTPDNQIDPHGVALIGPTGFTGAIEADFGSPLADPGVDIFGTRIKLNHAAIGFRDSAFVLAEISGHIRMPWMDHYLGVIIGYHLNGHLEVTLDTHDHPAVITLGQDNTSPSHVGVDFAFRSFSIDYNVNDHSVSFITDVTVTPRFQIPGIPTPPPIALNGLTFTPPDKVRLTGGWIDLPHAITMTVFGFRLELTRIGLGSRPNPAGSGPDQNYIGFSGGIHFIDGLPAGVSVDGLKIYFHEDGSGFHVDDFELRGIGLTLSVPGAFSFDGHVEFGDQQFTLADGHQQTYKVATGSIALTIIPISLTVQARLLIMTQPFPAAFIEISADLPAPGVTLGPTGLALYGLEGLLAINMTPNKRQDEPWFGDHVAGTGWYWRDPGGQIDDPIKKWQPNPNGFAIGVGATFGTAADNGHAFAMKALILLTLPGPVLLIQGKATFLSGRDDLGPGRTPPFEALMVVSPDELLINMAVNYTFKPQLEVFKVNADAEIYFNFHDARDWHIYIGQQDPPEKKVHMRLFHLVDATAYFMLTNDWLKLGAHVGYTFSWGGGFNTGSGAVSVAASLRVKLDFYIEGEAQITFRPFQAEATLHLHGEFALQFTFDLSVHIHIPLPFGCSIRIDFEIHFAFGISILLDAIVTLQTPKPFALFGDIHVAVSVQYLGSFDFDLPFSFGEHPPMSLPDLLSVTERDEQAGDLNVHLVHPLLANLHAADGTPITSVPAYTVKNGDLATAVSHAMSNPAPMDWLPVIPFKQDINNFSGVGEPVAPVPNAVTLGDYTYTFGLRRLSIFVANSDGTAGTDITSQVTGRFQPAPGSSVQPGERALVLNTNNAFLSSQAQAGQQLPHFVQTAYPAGPCGAPPSHSPAFIQVLVQHSKVSDPVNPWVRTTPFTINGVTFDPRGTLAWWDDAAPNNLLPSGPLRITFPETVDLVTLRFKRTKLQSQKGPSATGTAFIHGAQIAGPVQANQVSTDEWDMTVLKVEGGTAPDLDAINIDSSGLELMEVDYFLAADHAAYSAALDLHGSMMAFAGAEQTHWNAVDSVGVLPPNTLFRIEIATDASVSATNPTRSSPALGNPESVSGAPGDPDIILFATGGPPTDDFGAAHGTYPLTTYIETAAPTPGDATTDPPITPVAAGWNLPARGAGSAYTGYDVGVGFKVPWVTRMFTDAGHTPNLRIVLRPSDAKTASPPASPVARYIPGAPTPNGSTEQATIDWVNNSGCGPAGGIQRQPGSWASFRPDGGLHPNAAYIADLRWRDVGGTDHLLYHWAFSTGAFATFSDMIGSWEGSLWPAATSATPGSLTSIIGGTGSEASKFDRLAAAMGLNLTGPSLPQVTTLTLLQTAGASPTRLGFLVETPQAVDWTRTTLSLGHSSAGLQRKLSRRGLLTLRPHDLPSISATVVRSADSSRAFIFPGSGSSLSVATGNYALTWTFTRATGRAGDPIYAIKGDTTFGAPGGHETPSIGFKVT